MPGRVTPPRIAHLPSRHPHRSTPQPTPPLIAAHPQVRQHPRLGYLTPHSQQPRLGQNQTLHSLPTRRPQNMEAQAPLQPHLYEPGSRGPVLTAQGLRQNIQVEVEWGFPGVLRRQGH